MKRYPVHTLGESGADLFGLRLRLVMRRKRGLMDGRRLFAFSSPLSTAGPGDGHGDATLCRRPSVSSVMVSSV
jgi:hypothetical protein